MKKSNKEVTASSCSSFAEGEQQDWQAFVARMYGSLAEDPIERGSQGEYERRESLE